MPPVGGSPDEHALGERQAGIPGAAGAGDHARTEGRPARPGSRGGPRSQAWAAQRPCRTSRRDQRGMGPDRRADPARRGVLLVRVPRAGPAGPLDPVRAGRLRVLVAGRRPGPGARLGAVRHRRRAGGGHRAAGRGGDRQRAATGDRDLAGGHRGIRYGPARPRRARPRGLPDRLQEPAPGPARVKAVVCDRYGPPEVLRLDDVPRPVPGPDEVLIKIRATAVNRSDTETRAGTPPAARLVTGLRRPRHRILGSELAGVVEVAGPAVTEFTVGDDVFG